MGVFKGPVHPWDIKTYLNYVLETIIILLGVIMCSICVIRILCFSYLSVFRCFTPSPTIHCTPLLFSSSHTSSHHGRRLPSFPRHILHAQQYSTQTCVECDHVVKPCCYDLDRKVCTSKTFGRLPVCRQKTEESRQ